MAEVKKNYSKFDFLWLIPFGMKKGNLVKISGHDHNQDCWERNMFHAFLYYVYINTLIIRVKIHALIIRGNYNIYLVIYSIYSYAFVLDRKISIENDTSHEKKSIHAEITA